jgi:hypothetical protein
MLKEPYHSPEQAWRPDDDTDKVPMVKPENWHSGLPNPVSYSGLAEEPPYWQSPPERRVELATVEKWCFRVVLVVLGLYTSALAGIFLWKLLLEVVAIK